MHASESRANASSPPPINWAARPKPSQHKSSIHQQDNADEPSAPGRRLVPVQVFIDSDRICDLQEFLHHVGGSVCQRPKPEFQDKGVINVHRVEELSARFNQLEVNSGQSQPKSQVPDVLPTFSHLTTPRNSVSCNIFAARTDSPSPQGLSSPIAIRTPPINTPQVSPIKKKYYVVLVGKCTGIYYGEW